MNSYWTEAAQLYLILHQSCFRKVSVSQIWSSGSFEERLFPEALLSLFLSGGMIFISHLLRSVYFFISQSALHYMFGSFQSHLTKTYYWRYRVTTDIYHICIFYVLKISLIYITSITISMRTKLHIFAQFESLNKTELFFPPDSHYIRLYEP